MTSTQWIEKNLRTSGSINSAGWQNVFCPLHEDSQPSAGVNAGTNVFNCFKCGKMFLDELAGLMKVDAPEKNFIPNAGKKEEIARYTYTDAHGVTLYQQIKYRMPNGEKTFRGYNPAKDEWTLKDVERVPYRLPELLRAIEAEKPVYIVEGEKDADTLHAKGFTATTNSNGCKSTSQWRDFVKFFPSSATVYVCPDADADGMEHASAIAAMFRMHGCEVKLLNFGYEIKDKKLGGGQDVTDWFESGHTVDEFLELYKKQEVVKIRDDMDILKKVEAYKPGRRTDNGNALSLVHFYGDRLRWCGPWNKWLIWNGSYWEEDRSCRTFAYAQNIVELMLRKAETIKDEDFRKSLRQWAVKTDNLKPIKNLIECAKHHVTVLPELMDRDRWKLNCMNGIIDLKTGLMEPPDQNQLMTRAATVAYKPESKCPRWEAFLEKIFQGNGELIEYVQKVIGYCLTGSVGERCFFILHGRGQNGKTTLVETIKHIMSDYAKTAGPETVMKKQGDEGIRNDIARLQSARLVSVSETQKGRSLDENSIKLMSGNDRLTARFLHAEFFEFDPQFKILLYTNHKPRVSGDDPALWKRLRLIPFNYQITDAEKIDGFQDILINEESEGILAWAVEGCLKWQRDGLKNPPEVTAATESYKSGEDTVSQFLRAVCYVDTNNALISIKGSELLEKFHTWSGSNKLYARAFYEILLAHGIERDDRRDGIYLKGVALASDDDPVFRQPAPDKTDDKEEAMRKAGLF